MKTINLTYPYEASQIPEGEIVLVLGFFDGVHRGHQAVIAKGAEIAKAKGHKLAVMSFDISPVALFAPDQAPAYLTSVAEKAQLLEELGVDIFYLVSFTKAFAALSPQDFERHFMKGLHAQTLVAGFDYRYGYKAAGKLEDLQARDKSLEVVIVPKFQDQGQKVSSTAVRSALDAGKIEEANRLLGRPYTTSGPVTHGDARGRTIGYPTANVAVSDQKFLPAHGVYVVALNYQGRWHGGMASIGRNITFGEDRKVTVEVNILDFSQDIYEQEVTVAWLHRLRGEIKFTGIDGLVDQLARDEHYARLLLDHGLWSLKTLEVGDLHD